MTIPVINAVINFSTGPGFAQAFIIGDGRLGTNILADSAAVIVDVSNVVDSVSIKRGRSATADEFQTGTLTLRIVDQNGSFNPQNKLALHGPARSNEKGFNNSYMARPNL